MNNAMLVLASSSPAKRQLIRAIYGNKVILYAPKFADSPPLRGSFRYAVAEAEKNALAKALEASENLWSVLKKGAFLGADTVVFLDEEILGKPRSKEEAKKFLEKLRGRWHVVITGIAIISKAPRAVRLNYSATHVLMRNYSEEEINYYLHTGEWKGKAGAYAIQGLGRILVRGIIGCYYNVVGLPISLIHEELLSLGIKLFSGNYC